MPLIQYIMFWSSGSYPKNTISSFASFFPIFFLFDFSFLWLGFFVLLCFLWFILHSARKRMNEEEEKTQIIVILRFFSYLCLFPFHIILSDVFEETQTNKNMISLWNLWQMCQFDCTVYLPMKNWLALFNLFVFMCMWMCVVFRINKETKKKSFIFFIARDMQ